MSKILKTDVIAAIESALELDFGTLTPLTSAEDVENWDSMGQLNILLALDQLFDGEVANIPDMAEAESITQIIDILLQHKLL